MIYWGDKGEVLHAHVCPICMREEKPSDSRQAYPCQECTNEGDMMKLKVCKNHKPKLVGSRVPAA